MVEYNYKKEIQESEVTNMTVNEYMNKNGFTNFEILDVKLERGYVSRKKDINIPYEDHELYIASGRRKGEVYICLPCFYSSRYFHRAYLKFR